MGEEGGKERGRNRKIETESCKLSIEQNEQKINLAMPSREGALESDYKRLVFRLKPHY